MNSIDVVRGIATWVVNRGESLKLGILTPKHIYDINNDAISFSLLYRRTHWYSCPRKRI